MTIYAITEGPRLPVKFGYTKRAHPVRRMKGLQASNPRTLTILWHGPGDRSDEAGLHALLRPSRAKGEWFHESDLVRLALVVLPVIGARGLVDLGRDGLLTFVPTAWGMPRFYVFAKDAGTVYWPNWKVEPYADLDIQARR